MNICPHCHQPILPTDPMHLSPLKRRIFDAVRRRPRTAEEFRRIVWADDPDGGPEDRKVLHVHVHQLNRLLAPYGVVIRAGKGVGAVYRARAAT